MTNKIHLERTTVAYCDWKLKHDSEINIAGKEILFIANHDILYFIETLATIGGLLKLI